MESHGRCTQRRDGPKRVRGDSRIRVAGINAGKLEYREGSVWGNPYLRVLQSQLEPYIAAELGPEYLTSVKSKTELRAIVSEIAGLRKKLAALEQRKAVLEGMKKK